MFTERRSYLHYRHKGDHTARDGRHKIMQAVSALREEVKTLRLEVDKLVWGTDPKFSYLELLFSRLFMDIVLEDAMRALNAEINLADAVPGLEGMGWVTWGVTGMFSRSPGPLSILQVDLLHLCSLVFLFQVSRPVIILST